MASCSTVQETAGLVDVLCAGGIDFIKDDELQSDGGQCPFEARVRAVMRIIDRHAERNGRKVRAISAGRVLDLPIMLLVCLGLIVLTEFILRGTVYGRTLSAVGQNRIAARLAGIPVNRVIATAFVISSVLVSLMGLVLGAYVGGAFLEMGQPYLLQSVAAVVIGGTLIFGGSASAVGVFFASVLLILLVTLMQIMQLPPGSQDMVQGVVVILVLALAGRDTVRARVPRKVETVV
jgi:ribose transport system permease protein